MMRKIAASLSVTTMALICAITPVVCRPASAAGPVQFEFSEASPDLGAASANLSWDALTSPAYPEIDGNRYGKTAGKYLISDFKVPLKSGDEYRAMLTCASLDKGHACRGIQLVIVDERKTPASLIQRVRLGDGHAPALLRAPEDGTIVMFKTIRAGDNTEANVYYINPVTGRFDERLTVNRKFPERMKLNISGAMKPGGIVEAESEKPAARQAIDMSGALEALVEDGLYQENGDPVKILENLKLIRGGWEEENIYSYGGVTMIDVGMTLVTLARHPVADVTASFSAGERGNMTVTSVRFEPYLPYRTE